MPVQNTADYLLRYRCWIVLGLTILLVAGVRLRLREMPLERDEGEYAYSGQLLLQGVPPYKESYNMKLPGTYAAYAVMMALFGQTPSGIHFGLLLVNAACVVLVFLIGRKLLDEVAGLAAAVSFGLLSLSPSTLGLAAHATHFVVFFALGGMLLVVSSQRSEVRGQSPDTRRSTLKSQLPNPQLFFSGLLFGLAFLMDQHGVFFMIFASVYLGFRYFTERSPGSRRREGRSGAPTLNPQLSVSQLFAFAGGCIAPYAGMCLILLVSGVFPRFVFWTISYASKYAGGNPVAMAPAMLREGIRLVVGMDTLLWLLPWAGALVMWQMVDGRWEIGEGRAQGSEVRGQKSEPIPHPRFFLTALFLCSVAAVSVGYYFRSHYFILLLPSLALLSGVAVSRGCYLVRHDRSIELFLAIPMLGLFILGTAAALIGNGETWFWKAPPAVVREIYGTTLFSEAVSVAEYIKSHSANDARVAIVGSEPEIYFYCHRRSATGYLYTYPLMEAQPYALRMQEEMISEIEQRRPEFVVYINDDRSWLARAEAPQRIFEWWTAYSSTQLDLLNTIEIGGREIKPEEARSEEAEGRSAATATRSFLLIYKRKT